MTSIFLLVPLALLLLCIAIWAFIWAVRNDQFEDLDTQASRILFDDEPPPAPPAEDSPKRPGR
jgi:cbb3-type cytochrome oxidase maturation protein